MENKRTTSTSNTEKNSEKTTKLFTELKPLKTFEFDASQGFVCDVNTGICGPATQEKEEKK